MPATPSTDPIANARAISGARAANAARRLAARARLLALLLAALLLALLSPLHHAARAQASGIDALLAPFESGAPLPPLLEGLPLEEGRAYAILAQIMPPYTAYFGEPNSARRALLRGINPFIVERAGTQLGHSFVGWRCADGRFGLTGMTADEDGATERMLRNGWGLAALLSELQTGKLHARDELTEGWLRALQRRDAQAVAFEISPQACQRMRRSLARYLTHPNRPAQRFSTIAEPSRMQGASCASFARWLASEGGVFEGVPRALFWREVTLRDSFIGEAPEAPAAIVPFRMSARGVSPSEIGLLEMFFGDWTSGREVGQVRFDDPELMIAALDRAYARAGQPREPRMPTHDAQARALEAEVDRWLSRYGRLTPVRMGRTRAVVMHRR